MLLIVKSISYPLGLVVTVEGPAEYIKIPPLEIPENLPEQLGLRFVNLGEAISAFAEPANTCRIFLDKDSSDRYIFTQTVIDNGSLDRIFGGDWIGGQGTLGEMSYEFLRRQNAASVDAFREGDSSPTDSTAVHQVGLKNCQHPMHHPAIFSGITAGWIESKNLRSVNLFEAIAKVHDPRERVFFDTVTSHRYLVGPPCNMAEIAATCEGVWVDCSGSSEESRAARYELLRRVTLHLNFPVNPAVTASRN